MKKVVSRFSIQDETIDFLLSDENVSVKFRGRECKNLQDFVHYFPQILSKKNPLVVAILYNFFSYGMQYIVIDNVEAFKERFKNRHTSLKEPSVNPKTSISLDSIRPPYVEEGRLIYYVEERNSGQPYRANIPFPFADGMKFSRYELIKINS